MTSYNREIVFAGGAKFARGYAKRENAFAATTCMEEVTRQIAEGREHVHIIEFTDGKVSRDWYYVISGLDHTNTDLRMKSYKRRKRLSGQVITLLKVAAIFVGFISAIFLFAFLFSLVIKYGII